jgi:hypothetical protein
VLTCTRLVRHAAGLVAIACLAATPAAAQSFAPYSEFQALTPQQLLDLDLKLTYIGSQFAPIQTRMLQAQSSGGAGQFAALRRPGISYGNDTLAISFTLVTVAELDALLDSVATLPGVTDGGVDAGGFLSFALRDTAGGTRGFESIVDETNGRALFARMRGALVANASARRTLDEMACELDLLSLTEPADVTASAQIVMGGVHLVRATGRFAGTVRVTNTSAVTLPAPLTLTVATFPNVRLAGEYGVTCRVTPSGAPYIVLDVGAGLAPGAFVDRILEFENPDLDAIGATFHLHSGSGSR